MKKKNWIIKKNKKLNTKKKKNNSKKNIKGQAELLATIFFLALALVVLRRCMWPASNDAGWEDTVESADVSEESTLGTGILPAQEGKCGRPEITKDYLSKNPYSRSGISLKKVKGIVVHYVSNPKTTAKQNRDYFEDLQNTHLTKASSHFIIGLDGEIIQCIPLNEISYASNNRNSDTISIECCHKKKNGKFTKKTYASLLKLTAWLCDTYGLDTSDVIRHYDVTGKLCPLYYVKHQDAWDKFLLKLENKLK